MYYYLTLYPLTMSISGCGNLIQHLDLRYMSVGMYFFYVIIRTSVDALCRDDTDQLYMP